jgi:DNA-binding NarL/FixJ family response regulator
MERKPAARLVIADDHRLLADACKSLLEPEFQVLEIVTDGRSLVRSALAHKPEVVILDRSCLS